MFAPLKRSAPVNVVGPFRFAFRDIFVFNAWFPTLTSLTIFAVGPSSCCTKEVVAISKEEVPVGIVREYVAGFPPVPVSAGELNGA